jgi:hypothetical protein
VVLPDTRNRNQLVKVKRQEQDEGFIDGTGASNPASCNDAAPFSLINGQLRVNDQTVGTDPGVAFAPIRASREGSILEAFSVTNGILSWTNEIFYGGRAGFCRDNTGETYATFVSNPIGLVNCTTVNLLVLLGKLLHPNQLV